MHLEVSDRGVRLTPTWRLLAAVGLPSFEIRWDTVDQIQTLIPPIGSRRHGVRLVLQRRGAAHELRGLARVLGPISRRPSLGLIEGDVERFLALAPARIRRRDKRGIFWWP